jgi:hypothetical protein
MMLLTAQPTLLIDEVKDDFGPDYIVRFRKRGKGGIREFEIDSKGSLPALTTRQTSHSVHPAIQQVKKHGPFARLVCLFLFTMENDGAWLTWAVEPFQSDSGKPRLRLNNLPTCQPLDEAALKDIIAHVDTWHEALSRSLMASAPRRIRAGGTRHAKRRTRKVGPRHGPGSESSRIIEGGNGAIMWENGWNQSLAKVRGTPDEKMAANCNGSFLDYLHLFHAL